MYDANIVVQFEVAGTSEVEILHTTSSSPPPPSPILPKTPPKSTVSLASRVFDSSGSTRNRFISDSAASTKILDFARVDLCVRIAFLPVYRNECRISYNFPGFFLVVVALLGSGRSVWVLRWWDILSGGGIAFGEYTCFRVGESFVLN